MFYGLPDLLKRAIGRGWTRGDKQRQETEGVGGEGENAVYQKHVWIPGSQESCIKKTLPDPTKSRGQKIRDFWSVDVTALPETMLFISLTQRELLI